MAHQRHNLNSRIVIAAASALCAPAFAHGAQEISPAPPANPAVEKAGPLEGKIPRISLRRAPDEEPGAADAHEKPPAPPTPSAAKITPIPLAPTPDEKPAVAAAQAAPAQPEPDLMSNLAPSRPSSNV